MLFLILVVAISIVFFILRLKNKKKNTTTYSTVDEYTWKYPQGFWEHVKFFAVMAEAYSCFADNDYINLIICWDRNISEYSVRFFDVDQTNFYEETYAGKYLYKLCISESTSCYSSNLQKKTFTTFDVQDVLGYIQKDAPHAHYSFERSQQNENYHLMCFVFYKHDLSYDLIPEQIDKTITQVLL